MTVFDSITIVQFSDLRVLCLNHKIMANYKTFCILFVLMLPTVSIQASTHLGSFPIDSLPSSSDQLKLVEIEDQLTRSPHYKNRNAAGRLAVFSRTAPAATKSTTKKLTGPAYKNRKRVATPVDSTNTAPSPQRKLMAPRYKNRSAKSRRVTQ
ncbi:MAG: hypothetical protein ACI819_001520 [Neolewinella sp.]